MSNGPEVLDNLLEKARRSFEAAEGLLEDGHADFAASRAYYGCFYVSEFDNYIRVITSADRQRLINAFRD